MTCTSCTSPAPAGARFCPHCGTMLKPSPAPADQQRKLVTVVFGDLVGSTELSERLDPETLRGVTMRYFAAMREQIERYGGTVEKFIGDAVMAVFGVPVMHEDDAARAIAAAYGMRTALHTLNAGLTRELGITLGIRIGVHTGPVVTGADVSQRQALVSGQPVNVAARLQGHAAPGEILIGDRTRREAGPAAQVETIGAVHLRGVREPVRTHRLCGVGEDTPELRRRFDVPFVGRSGDLAALDAALDGVAAAGAARLVTVYGEPGIGKTRLLREWLDRRRRPTLHGTGRCRPYGEHGSLAPLADAIRPFGTAGVSADVTAVLDSGLLLDGTPGPSPAATGAAVAGLLASLARQQPVVLVLDDVQWASVPLLDLARRLGTGADTGPVLIVCLARHDLLEHGGVPTADRWQLAGLPPADCAALVASLAADGVDLAGPLAHLVTPAGGNPLFLEQLCAAGATAGPRGALPQTLQALLGARVDALPVEERTILETAAVWGAEFTARQVGGTPELLARLAHRRMVDHTATGGYRFRNGLIRSAVYEAMAKATRARRHERAADVLIAERGLAAAVGSHLERAYRLRCELGDADDTLRLHAAARLGDGGAAALARSDLTWADSLLDRTVRLLTPADAPWATAARRLGEVRLARGATAAGYALLTRVRDGAAEIDAAHARLRLAVADGLPADEVAALGGRLLPLFSAAGDQLGQARVRIRQAQARQSHGRHAEAVALLERALSHARLAGAEPELALALGAAGISLWRGPTPVPVAAGRCRDLLRCYGASRPAVRLTLTCSLAVLQALDGAPDAARQSLDEVERMAADLGYAEAAVVLPRFAAAVESAAGCPDLALRHIEKAAEAGAAVPQVACEATRLLLDLGDDEAARRWLPTSPPALPRAEQADLDGLRARLAARRGDTGRALLLASRAVRAAGQTDSPLVRATAAEDRAEVFALVGDPGRARTARRRARHLYTVKGVVR